MTNEKNHKADSYVESIQPVASIPKAMKRRVEAKKEDRTIKAPKGEIWLTES